MPFPESLAHLPPTPSSSCQAPITHLALIFSPPFSFYTPFPYDPCHSLSFYHPSEEKDRKKKEKDSQRERERYILASMRKPETGRRSEHCQQIIDFQQPSQEAVQSRGPMKHIKKNNKKSMRSANSDEMPPLTAKSSQTAYDKMAIGSLLFWEDTCSRTELLFYRFRYQRAGNRTFSCNFFFFVHPCIIIT